MLLQDETTIVRCYPVVGFVLFLLIASNSILRRSSEPHAEWTGGFEPTPCR